MAQQRFSAATSALILIDHQLGTLQLVKTLDVDRVKRHTLALARAAGILNMPVVLTSSMEEYIQGPLLPELAKILPDAFAKRIKRAGIVNAWDDPHFKAAVMATQRRQLIMGGQLIQILQNTHPRCSSNCVRSPSFPILRRRQWPYRRGWAHPARPPGRSRGLPGTDPHSANAVRR